MCVLQKQTKSTMQDISSQRKLTVMSESEEDNSRIHELWQRGAQHSKHLYHEYTTLVLINIHIGNIMLSRVFLRNNKRRQQQMIFVHWEPVYHSQASKWLHSKQQEDGFQIAQTALINGWINSIQCSSCSLMKSVEHQRRHRWQRATETFLSLFELSTPMWTWLI